MRHFLTLSVLILASVAGANEVGQSVDGVATISNGEGQSRILLSLQPEVEAENAAVWKARLRFELAGTEAERVLPVVLHPITSPWNPGAVSWQSGWQTPGGDFDEELFARAELNLGAPGPVSIDVTSLVKEIVEDGYTCYGFILTADRSVGVGISSEDLSRFENLGAAEMDISYRTTPPLPRAVIRSQEG